MSNTSATGGYLAPTGPAPLDGAALTDAIQAAIAGITGLQGAFVRPRWQPKPPNQPAVGTDWCAFGIISRQADDYPAIVHDGAGDGSDQMQRHETADVLASFIGPNCQTFAMTLRDGLYLPQNLEALQAAGITLLDVGQMLAVPDLINQQWVNRCDLPVRLRRQIDRTYPVLNILSASGPIQSETTTQPWKVE